MASATQYSDYYYNNTSYQHYHHHHQSQQQNYGYSTSTGQTTYDCKNHLNANDAYNNYAYNSPNNYNDQWTQHYNAIQHHQTQPHYHQQHLNMLGNQINDDYKNYSQQTNLNCNQYVDESSKNDLFYGQQQQQQQSTAVSVPSSQLTETKKRKIDNSDDSPALRALLTKPAKRAKSSPYFYHSTQQGSISPASSTDNYPQHYQLPSVTVNAVATEEQLVNLNHYNQPTKEGYEAETKTTTLDGKFSAASLFAPSEATNSPMSSFMSPPSSPKDKNDESAEWNESNGGLFALKNSKIDEFY
jgi:hypothetical protein